MKIAKTSLALAISSALLSSSLYAASNEASDQDLEVITVTTDFRNNSLMSTPAALTVLSADEIGTRQAQNLEEVIALAPNVNFSSGTQRARYYQIRGIGERSQFQEPINPSVGMIIDGVDFTGLGSVASMFDVDQVEIFRGPQGTRFGANALAGLINITTAAQTEQFEGRVKLTAGNYNSYGAGIALSGPASEKVNYRVALEQYQSDGFIENTYLDKEDTNNRDELTARGKLNIELSGVHTLDLALFYADFDNGYDAFSLDNDRTTMSDQPGVDKQETIAFNATSKYTALDFADLVTILSVADSDLQYGYDEDWSFVGLHPWEYSSVDNYFRDKSIASGEIRFVSKPSSKLFENTTEWVAGVYAKQEEESLTRKYTYLDADFDSDFETSTYAAYVQFDSQLSEDLTLTTGLRVESRSADYDNSDGTSFSPDDTMVGGKAVLSYRTDENGLVYGSVNRGYKAGGVNTDGTLPADLRVFDPEYVWNYELGYKYSFDGGYARIAAFYMDRQDMQVKSSEERPREDGSTEFVIYLGNAAEGTNQGIEFDAAYQLNDSIEVYGALGYLDTELSGFVNQNGEDMSGRAQAHAPKYTANLGLNAYLTDNLYVNVSLDAKDEYYFSDSHNEKSDSYTVLNASVNYDVAGWQLSVWGRNITDKDYKVRGFYFGNDPRDGYEAKQYFQLGEPAVFGVTANYSF